VRLRFARSWRRPRNSNLPPLRKTAAIFAVNLRWTFASSRKKGPGDHTIKSSTEEVRILRSGALDGNCWKVGSECCDHSR
jgi:hypothetical protein